MIYIFKIGTVWGKDDIAKKLKEEGINPSNENLGLFACDKIQNKFKNVLTDYGNEILQTIIWDLENENKFN